METVSRPWPALWALVLGFFMILVDSTIVSIANPAILRDLQTDITAVIWVTSAYLLSYAVPLLITGRLGDRFGPKRIYLIGLVVFTLASLWCGFSGDIGMLIAARAVQGLGAALMTPQTMSVITRVFAPDKRGAAMGLWGAVAGVATLVGPILGGFLVDGLGWEWIFFVNVPVGIVAFVLAWRLVPDLETKAHSFDWLGVVLSALGLFLLVFGIQEGETFDWGQIVGPISVWGLIVSGALVLVAFVVWQRFNRKEPLLPLGLFRDRNFTVANLGISVLGLAIVSMPLPIAFYFQTARALEPTQAALMLVPMAVVSGVMAVRGTLDRPDRAALDCLRGIPDRRRFARVDVAAHDGGPALLAAADPTRVPGPWALRALGAARDERDEEPASRACRGRVRRLQHDAPGRLGPRVGRDRGSHQLTARRRTAWDAGRGRRAEQRRAASGRR